MTIPNINFKFILKQLLIVFVIISVVFNSGYAMYTLENRFGNITLLISTILLIILYVLKLLKNNFKIFHLRINVFFLLLIIMCLSSILIEENISFGLIINILLAFLIAYNFDSKRIFSLFSNMMLIISIVSLVFYIIMRFFNIDSLFNEFRNENYVLYKNFIVYFTYIPSTKRNMGIFWEPGMFGMFLIMALIIEIFMKKTNNNKIIVFIVTLLTTLSSAAYFMLPFSIILILSKKFKSEKKIIMTITILILVFSIIIYTPLVEYLATVNKELFNDLVIENLMQSSRWKEIEYSIEIFLKHPFGVGYLNNVKAYEEFTSDVIYQTSTISFYLVSFGVFGLMFITYIGVILIKGINATFFEKIIIIFLIVCVMSAEPLMYNTFIYILFFTILKYNKYDRGISC